MTTYVMQCTYDSTTHGTYPDLATAQADAVAQRSLHGTTQTIEREGLDAGITG